MSVIMTKARRYRARRKKLKSQMRTEVLSSARSHHARAVLLWTVVGGRLVCSRARLPAATLWHHHELRLLTEEIGLVVLTRRQRVLEYIRERRCAVCHLSNR
jgi:hypothetical protein